MDEQVQARVARLARLFADVRTVLTQLEAPGPLRSLLSVIGEQLETLEAQLAALYDDLFVDTCPDCESG